MSEQIQKLDFIPRFRPKKPKRFSEEAWLTLDEPQVILFQGMRGSGKGVSVESTAEKLYKEGFNIWHLWSARSFENLYWSVNEHCREKYQKMKCITDSFFNEDESKNLLERSLVTGIIKSKDEFHKFLEIMIQENMIKRINDKQVELIGDGCALARNELLHCKCHKAYPILWIVPDYVDFVEKTLDRFNKVYWNDFEEYKQNLSEISTQDKQLLEQGNLKKPTYLRPKPLIKTQHITPPTSKQRKEVFREEFTKAVLSAREDNRVLVLSPAIFEGEMDKFETIAEIFRMISYMMNKSGHFMPLTKEKVGKERKYWTKKQKNWHKVAIVINELRSVSPSSKMHGEKGASSSKKAIFDYIPEARHYSTWFLADYQNPSDIFDGVRYQANIVVIKRGSRNILGDNWGWLFDRVIRGRMGFLRGKFHKDIERPEQIEFFERKFPVIKRYSDERRPYVDALPDNEGYVTWINNEFKKMRFDMPSFHHKQSMDNFQLMTGIRWTVNMDKKPIEATSLSKSEQKQSVAQKKKSNEERMRNMHYMRTTEQKNWTQIKEEFVLQEKEGIIPYIGYANKTPNYFSNLYGRWLKKQNLTGASSVA